MRWAGVLVTSGLIASCGNDVASGPFEGLPLDGLFNVQLGAPVHVARDRQGVAHIYAETMADAMFVQGYVTAHDRLLQMDLLRREAAGTLAEVYGALDPTVIDRDLVMRMHRLKPLAEATLDAMKRSTDQADVKVAALLDQYASGVNRYVADLGAGLWTIDLSGADSGFDAQSFAPWTAVDSLVVARWWALSQSWTVPFELDATELYQGLRDTFDAAPPSNPAAAARQGIPRDLLKLAPVGNASTLAEVPEARPHVPRQLFDDARSLLGDPSRAGGTSFAVSSGLATDQLLPLTSPSQFYPTHLIVAPVPNDDGDAPVPNDEPFDVFGMTIPGIPGAMFGENGSFAWAGAASEHDVNDIYLEQIAPCGNADCVAWTDPQGTARSVVIQTRIERIAIGDHGALTGEVLATYEVVPHHGPILPAIDRATHQLVPRTASQALSVRYTGDQPTFELTALYKLARARSVDDGVRAQVGGQSLVMIDDAHHVGWTTSAVIPSRKPAAYAWDPYLRQDAMAPFFVLPGTGEGDWLDEPSLVIRAIDPAAGHVIAANGEPVGQTTYLGVDYAAGLRDQRIASLLGSGADLAAIQRDTRSGAGALLTPKILEALGRLDRQNGSPADVNPYLDALPPADLARLAGARALLAAWTFATSAGPDHDAAATALFHAWMHYFIERTFADELDAIGFDVWRLDDERLVRLVHAVLDDASSLVTSPTTRQPILCDNYRAADPDDSCTKMILQAMLDAMTHLESPAGFGTAETSAWRWGQLHRLTIDGQAGAAMDGDNSSVSRSDPSWRDLDGSAAAVGPALRMVVETAGGRVTVKWALPGGTIADRRSPHARDLIDGFAAGTLFDAAITVDQIVAAGETRWVFY